MKNKLKRLQYNYYLSTILYFLLWPLFIFSKRFCNKIKRKVKINGKVINYFDHEIIFPKNVGINFSSQVFWNGSNNVEPNTVKCISLLFKVGDIFFDIGSNFGIYTLLAKRINSNIQVFSFEPLPNLQIDNKLFLYLNGVTDYTLINSAISDVDGEADFYVPDSFISVSEISSSSLESDFHYNQKFKQSKIIVPTMTLNTFMNVNKSILTNKKIVLKIDIEGHEAHALKGARLFLKEFRPWIILEVDLHPVKLVSLVLELKISNYLIYTITNQGLFKLSPDFLAAYTGERDFILIPAELMGLNDYFNYSDFDLFIKSK